MSDLLQRGSTWLSGRLKAKAGQSVTYHRGAQQVTGGVTATIANQADRANNDPEIGVLNTSDRDFLIDAADLLLGGVEIEPKRGDKIKQTAAGGTIHVYEVSSPGDEPCWRWSDRYFIKRRIHTQLIGTE